MKIFRLLITMIVVNCLAACGPTVVRVNPVFEFPTPLVEPLPLKMGVFYPEEFRNFVYDESKDTQGVDDTSIELGSAQVSLLDRIFLAYFEQVQVLEPGESASVRSGLDAVLVPQVVDVEYSVPRTSNAKIYEVWIKYQFNLLEPDGTTIATWTMPTYGKTPTAMLKSSKEAINLASMMALRDCGAAFITGFHKVPEVAQWLDSSIGSDSRAIRSNNQEGNHE